MEITPLNTVAPPINSPVVSCVSVARYRHSTAPNP